MINYGKQSIDEKDVNAVVETLNSDWLTQGPKVEEFEQLLAQYCGAKYAVVVSSGTAALHLANLVIGSKKKSHVITTPISFLATSNSVIYAGGHPVFSDISAGDFNLDVKNIERLVKGDKEYDGIIPVHLGGAVCDMESIKKIADANNLWIIEDACHAFGGKWRDKNGNLHSVGDCSHSDMTIFSFHPVKQMTTGEGGAVTTNNKALYQKLLMLRTHGMTKEKDILLSNHGEWYYEMHELGFNYRMTDFQAALGIEQLRKNDNWVKRRRVLVNQYDLAFKENLHISHQERADVSGEYSYHLYIIQCKKRKELYQYLKLNGINTQVHYIPIHLQPYYSKNYGYGPGDYPVAEQYYNNALSLPLYQTLTNSDQEKIISLVNKFYE